MGHRKGNKLLPVLRTGEPPRGFQPFVQGRRRQWGQQAKNRQPRRPSANFLQSSLRHARRVIVHAKDKRGDGKNVAPGEPVEHHSIFTWFVKAFFYVSKVGRIDGFHSDEDPPASRARAFSSSSSFTTLSFVRKRMESPKNPVTVQNSHP